MSAVHTGRYNKDNKRLSEIRKSHEKMTRLLLAESDVLDADERIFLSMIQEAGFRFSQIAKLRGEHCGTVSRRYKGLLRRLRTAGLAHTLSRSGRLSPVEIAILTEVYIRRTPHKDIAAKLGISVYRIRKTLRRIGAPVRRARPRAASRGPVHRKPITRH